MKIVQLNATSGKGSTGKIVMAVSRLLDEKSVENYIFFSLKESDHTNSIRYTTPGSIKIHTLISRILGNYGFENKRDTRKLLSYLKEIQPDVIHLHNIHSHDCNLQMLFDYIRENGIKTYWTFHDCWAFTGYCPHFDMIGCNRWKTQCRNCPQKKEYSWFFDRSKSNFQKKKALFAGVDLTIVTPSRWLSNQVKESFLKEHPVRVIHNGIDLTIFCPRESNFRETHNCQDKTILLGVAFGWGEKKGLDVFLELAKRLDEKYQIVLVGTNEKIDKQLPENIISIHRTNNQAELAEIYTAADLFVNPTREENYPTVNMEALACGTPVLTFQTGGSGEMIDESCGSSVPRNDIDGMHREIVRICENKPYSREACLARAKAFDEKDRYQEYLTLYEE